MTDLEDETGPTYTATADDVGNNIQVRVVFDDDLQNREYPRYSPQVTVLSAPPKVTGVALTSNLPNPAYAIGGVVETTVYFSEAVDITGTPQLELDFAGTPIEVDCTAATNTTFMGCYYEVVAGDVAAGGVAIAANKLTLNDGTITAAGATTAAVLTHSAVAIDADHKVDGIRPTLVTTSPDAPKTSADGRKVLLKFSESLDAAVAADFTVSVAGSDATVENATLFVGGEVEVTLAAGDAVAAGETVTIALAAGAVEDTAGNGNLALAATTVTNNVGSSVLTPPAPR